MTHPPRAVLRAVRSLVVGGAVAATTLAGTVPADAAARPALTLEAARHVVTLYRYSDGSESAVYGDLGVYAVADAKQAFEVRVKRRSYDQPLVARLVRRGKDRTLPVPPDFGGLADFSRTTFRNSKGAVVGTSTASFCPNVYGAVRRSPKAPASSPYPTDGCDTENPYLLGAVWGIQAGYAATLGDQDSESGGLPDLPVGSYMATTSITPAYRAALRIPASRASATVFVNVVAATDDCLAPDGCLLPGRARQASRRAAAATEAAAPTRLAGKKSKPSGPLPDLRSLPAWGIVSDGRYLNFGATVWNAGPGRLVVDGFRDSTNADRMKAYQYFFSASGRQKGYARVGSMEWDARQHHQHWHFKDFARYSLVSADSKIRVVSGKEAFCLANTDPVDYTVKGASWHPGNTDLSTACGVRDSLGVREVLDTGSGDTYQQFREGQGFDLTGVPNGAYDIEVVANPSHKLYETSTTNNVSRRRVVIGGSGQHRTVVVAKVGIIDEPPVEDDGEGAARR